MGSNVGVLLVLLRLTLKRRNCSDIEEHDRLAAEDKLRKGGA